MFFSCRQISNTVKQAAVKTSTFKFKNKTGQDRVEIMTVTKPGLEQDLANV